MDLSKFGREETNASHWGEVHGPFLKEELVCHTQNMLTSKGIFLNTNPLKYAMPLLLLQMSVIIITSRLIFRILQPLKQGMISAQAGVGLGPSFLGHGARYMDMFVPAGGKIRIQTLSNIGFIIQLFVLGLKIDASIIKKAVSKAIIIGTASYAFPFSLGNLTVMFVNKTLGLPNEVICCSGTVISLSSMTSFPVTTTVLAELNILNSKLRRLATNCSMVCEVCSWFVALAFNFYTRERTRTSAYAIFMILGLLGVIYGIFRPLIVWLTERKSKSMNNKDVVPFFPVLLILSLASLSAEAIGVHAAFGAFWLGISLPDSPPLGTKVSMKVTMKLETFASNLFLPCFIAISGLQTNFFEITESHEHHVVLIEITCLHVHLYGQTELVTISERYISPKRY